MKFRFTVGINAAENTNYIKKCFKYKLSRMQFLTKKVSGRICLSIPGVELGLQGLMCSKYCNVLKWESRLAVGLKYA